MERHSCGSVLCHPGDLQTGEKPTRSDLLNKNGRHATSVLSGTSEELQVYSPPPPMNLNLIILMFILSSNTRLASPIIFVCLHVVSDQSCCLLPQVHKADVSVGIDPHVPQDPASPLPCILHLLIEVEFIPLLCSSVGPSFYRILHDYAQLASNFYLQPCACKPTQLHARSHSR